MIVVSNTSPIINLACVKHLDLLRQLYKEVTIPKAVQEEITVKGAGEAGAREVKSLKWIKTQKVKNPELAQALALELDSGESEAIALAKELRADIVLMDERRGRAVAKRLGLRYLGILGVLIEAKHANLIQSVKPILNSLISEAGFWISRELYDRVMTVSHESS